MSSSTRKSRPRRVLSKRSKKHRGTRSAMKKRRSYRGNLPKEFRASNAIPRLKYFSLKMYGTNLRYHVRFFDGVDEFDKPISAERMLTYVHKNFWFPTEYHDTGIPTQDTLHDIPQPRLVNDNKEVYMYFQRFLPVKFLIEKITAQQYLLLNSELNFNNKTLPVDDILPVVLEKGFIKSKSLPNDIMVFKNNYHEFSEKYYPELYQMEQESKPDEVINDELTSMNIDVNDVSTFMNIDEFI